MAKIMNRKYIKKVLMCKPLYFSELDYSINPWMTPGKINEQHAMKEWSELVSIYKNLGIQVEIIDQKHGVPDMVFATDQGIVRGNKVLLSQFWFDERKNESQHYEQWFEEQGYEITKLPPGVYFEGNGDSYFLHDKLLIGIGYRADEYTCRTVSSLLDIEVVPLQITDPKFYHLDVGFFPLNAETAFYYPKAFSKESRKVLKKLIPNLIEFTAEEANGFCANSVVSGDHVIHQKDNPTFEAKLKDLGYKAISVDLHEFKKSGGGTHCLTNILEEE